MKPNEFRQQLLENPYIKLALGLTTQEKLINEEVERLKAWWSNNGQLVLDKDFPFVLHWQDILHIPTPVWRYISNYKVIVTIADSKESLNEKLDLVSQQYKIYKQLSYPTRVSEFVTYSIDVFDKTFTGTYGTIFSKAYNLGYMECNKEGYKFIETIEKKQKPLYKIAIPDNIDFYVCLLLTKEG